MFARLFPSIASLIIVSVGLGLPTVCCQTTNRPSDSRADGKSPGGFSIGGLKSILEDSVSPAFGATIIIIITVIVSGSAYLCLLKYICGGCCKPMQVVPSAGDPNKVEEQV